MDFIREILTFERWLTVNYLPSTAQLLWYKLFMLCNSAGWAEWFTASNHRLMVLSDIKSENTLDRNRNKLIVAGLIEYKKGKKGCPGRYKVNSLMECTAKNKVQTEVYPEVYMEVYPEVQTEVQTETILKDKDTYKHKPKEKEREKKPSPRFVPPTVDQVAAYCQSRANSIDPAQFVDFYASKGWMVGNTKMKDWQASVRTWERRNYTAPQAKPKQRNTIATIDEWLKDSEVIDI